MIKAINISKERLLSHAESLNASLQHKACRQDDAMHQTSLYSVHFPGLAQRENFITIKIV